MAIAFESLRAGWQSAAAFIQRKVTHPIKETRLRRQPALREKAQTSIPQRVSCNTAKATELKPSRHPGTGRLGKINQVLNNAHSQLTRIGHKVYWDSACPRKADYARIKSEYTKVENPNMSDTLSRYNFYGKTGARAVPSRLIVGFCRVIFISFIAALLATNGHARMGSTSSEEKQDSQVKAKSDFQLVATGNTMRDGDIAVREEFDVAMRVNTAAALQLFIARHPEHKLAVQARQALRKLRDR